jgi:membrane protein DedA with SNARE-associated domain
LPYQRESLVILTWLHSLLPHIPRYGYIVVFVAVFLNNVGVPLPGETIFIGAGFVMGKYAGNVWQPMAAGTAACFLGGLCSFWVGRRLSHDQLDRIRWLHLTPHSVGWPQRYFARHGAKTVLISRFIAIFPPAAVNVLAGMTTMSWRSFVSYNLAGSAGSTVSYILLGYLLGNRWPLIQVWLEIPWHYLALSAVILFALGIVFRAAVSRLWAAHVASPR